MSVLTIRGDKLGMGRTLIVVLFVPSFPSYSSLLGSSSSESDSGGGGAWTGSGLGS